MAELVKALRQDLGVRWPLVASIRIRQRRDGTVYTSVLYTLAGKQTSNSFDDHAEALRFQDVCNRLGPVEALKVLGHIPLQSLSRTDISTWVNKLRADGASGKTIGNKFGFLSGCLNLAVKAA
jgi:hypothetical protein